MLGCGEGGAAALQKFRRSSARIAGLELTAEESVCHIRGQAGEPQSCCSSFANEGSCLLLCCTALSSALRCGSAERTAGWSG